MSNIPESNFRWVHWMGGRFDAAKYLCSLGFGTTDETQMMKRLSHWTGIGKMSGNAVRALANDRGIRPGDMDVMTPDEYRRSISRDKAA